MRRASTPMSSSEAVNRGWSQRQCEACQGTGMRPGSGILYRCPANACQACEGRGATWISPQGRRAAYPGGPFMPR